MVAPPEAIDWVAPGGEDGVVGVPDADVGRRLAECGDVDRHLSRHGARSGSVVEDEATPLREGRARAHRRRRVKAALATGDHASRR